MNARAPWVGDAAAMRAGQQAPNRRDFPRFYGFNRRPNPSRRSIAYRPRLASLRETSMNTLIKIGLALGLGLALAGCGNSGGDTIKFGIGGPITGSDAAFGSQLKNGAEQAFADINAAGGILGKKISFT